MPGAVTSQLLRVAGSFATVCLFATSKDAIPRDVADDIPILFRSQVGLLYKPAEGEGEAAEWFERGFASNELAKWLEVDSEAVNRGVPILAFHGAHDASIAFSTNGRVQCVLELERLFGKRHLSMAQLDGVAAAWLQALQVFIDGCGTSSGRSVPKTFEYAVVTKFWYADAQSAKKDFLSFSEFRQLVESMIRIEKWRVVDHHTAHAFSGFYASPFRSAVIFTFDAGGNDGTFNVYLGTGTEIHLMTKYNLNMGHSYTEIGCMLPEVAGRSIDSMCSDSDAAISGDHVPCETEVRNAVPGKLMGYSAVSEEHPEVAGWIRQCLENNPQDPSLVKEARSVLLTFACQGLTSQRILAATLQAEWERYAYELISKSVLSIQDMISQSVEGVILAGGCALNVRFNQVFYNAFIESNDVPGGELQSPQKLYVPPHPGDEGLVVGALFAAVPPLAPQQLQYVGLDIFDKASLPSTAEMRGARSLSALGGIEFLADLLTGGAAWQQEPSRSRPVAEKPIVAVVRGRQEYGPRALGHRSLLAVPDSDAMRDRMNRLKARQWYRPVAPMIAEEELEKVFGREVKSPYMSMAPVVDQDVRKRFPAFAHLDGTAGNFSVVTG
eukprot:TRINITY_DN20792_c0_g1_i1.p1 TRINITY_DN20792_c0_g1~~TRINITY_DN20792_c0_g1_i1.p1  ORF type:complete len:611 (+),score=94.97 TRINITY_DN20792_c0_g1_i1:155-1987(+)